MVSKQAQVASRWGAVVFRSPAGSGVHAASRHGSYTSGAWVWLCPMSLRSPVNLSDRSLLRIGEALGLNTVAVSNESQRHSALDGWRQNPTETLCECTLLPDRYIDLMLWFLGWPDSVSAQVDKIPDLEIDNVDILVHYASGERVNLLDLIGRPHECSITAVGENGSLVYSYEDNVILYGTRGERSGTNNATRANATTCSWASPGTIWN